METTFDVPARTFLRVVYGDDGFFFRRFHHETGECPDASVPPWTARSSDATRVVVFTKTMSLPSVIERLLGSGTSMATLRFEETQTFAWDPATSTACVRSTPTLVSPRSESFQTEVAVYVCPDGDDPTRRCAMRAVIKVTASGTWALQPVVEKLMETRASASFREWVRFADTFLEENYGGSHVGDRPLPKLSAMPGGEEDAVVRGTAPEHATTTTTPPPSSSRAEQPPTEFPSSRSGGSAEETPGASASDSADFETDDDFDDARSVGSTSSFHSVRSAASSFGSGVGSWFGRRSSSGDGGTDCGGDDREAGENCQNGFDVGAPAPPSRTRSLPASPSPGFPGDGTGAKSAPGKRRSSRSGSVPPGIEPGSNGGTTPSGVPKIPSPPRGRRLRQLVVHADGPEGPRRCAPGTKTPAGCWRRWRRTCAPSGRRTRAESEVRRLVAGRAPGRRTDRRRFGVRCAPERTERTRSTRWGGRGCRERDVGRREVERGSVSPWASDTSRPGAREKLQREPSGGTFSATTLGFHRNRFRLVSRLVVLDSQRTCLIAHRCLACSIIRSRIS